MDNRKGIAIILAMFSAILVMLAGKSCADGMNKNREKGAKKPSAGNSVSVDYQEQTLTVAKGVREYTVTADSTMYTDNVEYITDILGRVIGTVEPSSADVTEGSTEPEIQYITDILGRVVDVIEPDTQPSTEDPTATTEHKNPLEEYREKHPEMTKPTKEKDIEEEHYTAPSSLYITIN